MLASVTGKSAAALAAWWGYAEADPVLVGLVVGAVAAFAVAYVVRRVVRRRQGRKPGTGRS
jgi:predicted PurR-regulated permease PerM